MGGRIVRRNIPTDFPCSFFERRETTAQAITASASTTNIIEKTALSDINPLYDFNVCSALKLYCSETAV